MLSLPESYRSTLQTITASECVAKLSGGQSHGMQANDLIAFIIKEAQHRVINKDHTKNAESALAAHVKILGNYKGKTKEKNQLDVTCGNCKKPRHSDADCYAKGGGKEGQVPWMKKTEKKPNAVVIAADDKEGALFAFTCTSDYTAMAQKLDILKSRLGMCIDSEASKDHCPDCTKFANYKSVKQDITTADGRMLTAIRMGDLHLDLPNGSEKTSIIFKNAVHAPDMAFTLISISRLNKARFSVTFNNGMCTVKNPQNKMIAIIPHSDGLYKIMAQTDKNTIEMANTTSTKMSISDAHQKLGHIAHSAIQHAISKGLITGIEIDSKSKPDFCEACAKAKLVCQPFPKESKTRAEHFGERVHWDLWGPASVKSLDGYTYMAAHIDNAT